MDIEQKFKEGDIVLLNQLYISPIKELRTVRCYSLCNGRIFVKLINKKGEIRTELEDRLIHLNEELKRKEELINELIDEFNDNVNEAIGNNKYYTEYISLKNNYDYRI